MRDLAGTYKFYEIYIANGRQTLEVHSRSRQFIPDINYPFREETSSDIIRVMMFIKLTWVPPGGSDDGDNDDDFNAEIHNFSGEIIFPNLHSGMGYAISSQFSPILARTPKLRASPVLRNHADRFTACLLGERAEFAVRTVAII